MWDVGFIYIYAGWLFRAVHTTLNVKHVAKRHDPSLWVFCSAHPLSYVCDLYSLCSVCYVVCIYWSIFTVVVPLLTPTWFIFVWFFHSHFVFYINLLRFHYSVIVVQLVDSLYATSFIFTYLHRKNNIMLK